MKVVIIKARNPREKIVSQPIGSLYIASVAKRLDCKVLFIDQLFYSYSEIEDKIKKFGVDVAGISSMIHEFNSVVCLSKLIKKVNPKAVVIVGGPYPTSFPLHCLNKTESDVAVCGEGEVAFEDILKIYKKKGTLFSSEIQDIRSLVFIKSSNEIKKYGENYYIDELDTIPEPAREFLEFEKYTKFHPHTPLLFGSRYADILTSRGCEFNCVFCHNLHGKKFRAHSSERVVSEIISIREKYNIKNIEILDDCFNYNSKRMEEIMKKLKELKLDINLFICGIRIDLLNKMEIELMREAGVRYIGIGIESADESIQRKIKKNINLEIAKKNISIVSKNRIFITAGIIFGHKEENIMSLLKTLLFVSLNNIHSIMVATLKVYPTTELSRIEDRVITPEVDDGLYTDYFSSDYRNKFHFIKTLFFKYLTNFFFYFNPIKLYLIFRDIPILNFKLIVLMFKKFIKRILLLS